MNILLLALVMGLIAYILLWLQKQHARYLRYMDLEQAAKEAREAEEARLAEKRARDQAHFEDASKKNKVSVEQQRREQAKRDAAERARDQARQARDRLAAQEAERQKRSAEDQALAVERAAEEAAARAAWEKEMREAAISRAEAAERQGKLLARMAAQRLSEYKIKKEAEDESNALIAQRPDELGQHCDIKAPLPVFASGKEADRGAIVLSAEAQRATPAKRAWLPSTGWKTESEGGESGTQWAKSFSKQEARPSEPTPQQHRHNVYPFADFLQGKSPDGEDLPPSIAGFDGGIFGFLGSSTAADGETSASPLTTPPETVPTPDVDPPQAPPSRAEPPAPSGKPAASGKRASPQKPPLPGKEGSSKSKSIAAPAVVSPQSTPAPPTLDANSNTSRTTSPPATSPAPKTGGGSSSSKPSRKGK